jgi:dephospho-CoA kinase
MLRIGLSGGIGSGKSTVAQRFSELGAIVIDADVLAREVVAPGSDGLARIAERFGDEVLDDDGALNRAALGAVVFADDRARRDLEAITHPLIAARTAALVDAAPDDALVVHDVPLLVEKQYGPVYHLVVIVDADPESRVKRLMHSRGMTEADARSRIAAQASDDERRAAADVWLDNDGTRDELLAAVDLLWEQRLVPFERNVRHRVRAERSEVLELRPSDPDWPAQAERLLGRLRLAFGDVLVTADHVGSTAVPGVPAKDVLDVQVGVPSLDAADGEGVRARLDEAGFPRAEGADFDFDHGSDGLWPKRMHGSSDPGRVVHIHVREVGSPGWRWALLFRDWIRDDREAAQEYAAEKARIAATGVSSSEYAEAKEPWFAAAAARAQEWAARTGWTPDDGHHG